MLGLGSITEETPLGGTALGAVCNVGDPGGACVTEGPGCEFGVAAVPEGLSVRPGCLGPKKNEWSRTGIYRLHGRYLCQS